MMPPKTKGVRFLVFLPIQLLVVLLLLEAGLRLLRPHHTGLNALLYIPLSKSDLGDVKSLEELLNSSIAGFMPLQERAGFILNSRSFSTGEYTDEKKAGVYRIMCVGDSFTDRMIGVPYADMWHALLDAELNRTKQREIEVFALGVAGVGPRFALRVWRFEHALVQADVVILAFFVGNDFTDQTRYNSCPWVENGPARLSYTWRLARNLHRIREQQNLGRQVLLDSATRDVRERGGIDLGGMWPIEDRPGAEIEYLEGRKHHIWWSRKEKRDNFLELVADVRNVIARFSAEVRASGSDFMVMIIPDDYQVDRSLLQRALAFNGLDADDMDVDLPQQCLKEFLEKDQIDYLDLLPVFRKHNKRLYLRNDEHWNIEGNRAAAQALATHLREGLLRDLPKRKAPAAGPAS